MGTDLQSQIERARKRKFKMDFKVLAMLLFAIAAAEASVIKDLLRPVAYAELGDDVDSDWDKDSSVVHKEEEEEDTELFEEEGGDERAMEGAAFVRQPERGMAGRGNQKNKAKKGKNGGRVWGRKPGNGQGRRKNGGAKRENGNGGKRNNNKNNNKNKGKGRNAQGNKGKNGNNGNKGKKNNAMKKEQKPTVEMPMVEKS